MAYEEIDHWIRARRGRQKRVADLIGVTQDMVSKSQKGVRAWKAPEVDAIRRLIAGEEGAGLEPVRSIPLLGDVPAGNPREAMRAAKGSIPVVDPSVPARAYALVVKGDSMDLVVPDGAKIILDPDDRDLYPGRYYVVLSADGDTTFKRYESDPARLVPCSSNPAHQPIAVGREQFTILARVIGSYARM